MASRITIAMLPAGRPPMRLDTPPEFKMQNAGKEDPTVTTGLALSEQIVQQEIETRDWRNITMQTIPQLLVAGNACEHQFPDNHIRVYRLDKYVVRRNYAGVVIEAVLEDPVTRETLPDDIKAPAGKTEDEEFILWTWIRRELKGRPKRPVYVVEQWLDDSKIRNRQFEEDELPYNFLRWTSIPGEDYGRSKFEEHAPDFRSMDSLEKARLEGAAMASRHLIMVRPGATGVGVKNRIATANNGDVVIGEPDGVELKSFENANGYALVSTHAQELIERLSRAWLLLSAGQRNAERVTATEIERDIQEIEAALGGNFSTLNVQMMERRITLLMANMERDKRLPPLKELGVRPTVLTGLEALSRERDVARASQLFQLLQMGGPDAIDTVKLEVPLAKATIGLGFADAIRTPEERQEIQQQRQAREAATAAAPAIARGGQSE